MVVWFGNDTWLSPESDCLDILYLKVVWFGNGTWLSLELTATRLFCLKRSWPRLQFHQLSPGKKLYKLCVNQKLIYAVSFNEPPLSPPLPSKEKNSVVDPDPDQDRDPDAYIIKQKKKEKP